MTNAPSNLFDELIQQARVVKRLVEVTVAGRVPSFQVSLRPASASDGHQRFLVDARIAALVERVDLNL